MATAKKSKQKAPATNEPTQPSAPAPAVVNPPQQAAAPVATVAKQPSQNGVTRPRSGTATGRVWEIADTLSEKLGKPAPRGDVMKQGVEEKLNQATIATQYGRWRKFYGLGKYSAAAEAEGAEVEGGEEDVETEE